MQVEVEEVQNLDQNWQNSHRGALLGRRGRALRLIFVLKKLGYYSSRFRGKGGMGVEGLLGVDGRREKREKV